MLSTRIGASFRTKLLRVLASLIYVLFVNVYCSQLAFISSSVNVVNPSLWGQWQKTNEDDWCWDCHARRPNWPANRCIQP